MKKEEHIERYTAEEIEQMLAQGQSKTDWERVRSMSEEEIEQGAEADPDSPAYPYPADFWKDGEIVSPKQKISIRLDPRIIDYFKRSGSGYQKRINAVLDEYVRQQLRREAHAKQD